jgi:hypothetical protein
MFRLTIATIREVVSRCTLSFVNRLSLELGLLRPKYLCVSYVVFILLRRFWNKYCEIGNRIYIILKSKTTFIM